MVIKDVSVVEPKVNAVEPLELWRGEAYPLGATSDGSGTNFAVFSEVAERVELCLFDADGAETRVTLPEVDGFVWHGFLPGVEPGQRYGYRFHGAHDPAAGQRCNPNKLLVDPYAKAIDGTFGWDQSLFGYDFGNPDSRNDDDSAAAMPKSVVISPFFDWGVDKPPGHEYADSVIYEAHVKGLTQTHPDIPERMRGTYAAIAHPVIIDHLKTLGITAIELMPVHHFANDSTLIDKGLSNYWGYNTIGFFAPDSKYASNITPGGQVQEFKAMVRALHEADIEVILLAKAPRAFRVCLPQHHPHGGPLPHCRSSCDLHRSIKPGQAKAPNPYAPACTIVTGAPPQRRSWFHRHGSIPKATESSTTILICRWRREDRRLRNPRVKGRRMPRVFRPSRAGIRVHTPTLDSGAAHGKVR